MAGLHFWLGDNGVDVGWKGQAPISICREEQGKLSLALAGEIERGCVMSTSTTSLFNSSRDYNLGHLKTHLPPRGFHSSTAHPRTLLL